LPAPQNKFQREALLVSKSSENASVHGGLTVRTATLLVIAPDPFVSTTKYLPASADCALLIGKALAVAAGMFVPFFFHWYAAPTTFVHETVSVTFAPGSTARLHGWRMIPGALLTRPMKWFQSQ
jgi:hypothetical protein